MSIQLIIFFVSSLALSIYTVIYLPINVFLSIHLFIFCISCLSFFVFLISYFLSYFIHSVHLLFFSLLFFTPFSQSRQHLGAINTSSTPLLSHFNPRSINISNNGIIPLIFALNTHGILPRPPN